ncbi:MAG: hypothetical protein P8Z78_00380 [Gammaproteobacteria bacterium]|jgi:hypothetical protein
MLRPYRSLALVVLAFLWLTETLRAEPLPKYLTLETALSFVDEQHPGVRLSGKEQLARRLRACLEPASALINTPLPDSQCGYWHFLSARQQQQLLVMRRFFDVALADKAAARDNEAMAIGFIDFDRASRRMELGQVSEIEVAELDTLYQEVRSRTLASQALQRSARSLLAIAMNRPKSFVEEVRIPDLKKFMEWKKPADEQKLHETIAQNNPVLANIAELADEAMGQLASQYLRHAALELLLAIDIHQAHRQQADVHMHYRDLYLDRSRTLYEFEVKADLGDAMTAQTASRVEKMEADFDLVMAIATLQMLQGKTLDELFDEN